MFHRQSFILQTTEDCFNFADSHFRSEEHTSELQSQSNLVCRLLLEKKKTTNQLFHALILSFARPPDSRFLTGSFLLVDRKVLHCFYLCRWTIRLNLPLVSWSLFTST